MEEELNVEEVVEEEVPEEVVEEVEEVVEEELEEVESENTDEELEGEIVESDVTVSGGDSIVFDNGALYAIRSDVQVLADSTIQGYLNSSIVSVFDRLVDNGNYRYYVAFRGVNEDSNAGTLYLSNECNGNQLNNCQVIRMYRVYTGQNYEYNYYYEVSYDDTEYFNFGNGALYYTNISTGYPSLGSAKTDKVLTWMPIMAVAMFLGCMMIRRKIKEC